MALLHIINSTTEASLPVLYLETRKGWYKGGVGMQKYNISNENVVLQNHSDVDQHLLENHPI